LLAGEWPERIEEIGLRCSIAARSASARCELTRGSLRAAFQPTARAALVRSPRRRTRGLIAISNPHECRFIAAGNGPDGSWIAERSASNSRL